MRNYKLVFFFMAVIVVFGFISLPKLKKNEFPDVTIRIGVARRPFWPSSLPSSIFSASNNQRISTFTCGSSCGSSLPRRCAVR